MATLPNPVRQNGSQVEGIRNALTQRLSLLWGPPGTGKSETSAALLVALIAQCRSEGRSVRIAITGPTWVAIDNVLRKLPSRIAEADVEFARLQSTESADRSVDPSLHRFLVRTKGSELGCQQLLQRLDDGGTTIVGATAQQLGKLSTLRSGEVEQFFDFMLVDEASQMDVAHAVVGFSTLSPDASVVVVGDHLQMAPIHPIDPPNGSEHVVGSIYDFYAKYRQEPAGNSNRAIKATMLNTSYRSNQEIVDFVATSGYQDLQAYDPGKRMLLYTPVPSERPEGLPKEMPWSRDMVKVLDPERPLAAIIHSDRYSSQRNDDEARLVASMVFGLTNRLCDKDVGVLSGVDFFRKGVGVVTPHRAQQSAVIEHMTEALQPDMPTKEEMIRSVDTVERFQGQEKLVMFASFGLGDGDQIGLEEEFLYDLNRFNVIVSRAETKAVIVLSRRMLDYLPRDLQALRDSRLLKDFAGGFLQASAPLSFPECRDLGECELRTR